MKWLAFIVYRLWSWTWRIQCVESEGLKRSRRLNEPLIFAHWHGCELMIFPLVAKYKIATMTSTSKDGQLVDFAIRKMGAKTSKGSSTRGGIGALKGLVRLMVQEKYNASMAVDGPKGPIYQAKPGAFELSRLAKAKLVPVGAKANSFVRFEKSWNKAELPKPFARIVVWFGEPLDVVNKETSPKDIALKAQLEDKITDACHHAENALT